MRYLARLLFFYCCCSLTTAVAQIPDRLAVDLRVFNGAEALNGTYHIIVRWYDVPVDGVWIEREEFDVDVVQGRVQLHLGTTVPIPQELLRSGSAWLGVSIDSGKELSPRTMLVSVAYAKHAERAEVADRLSGDVTGLVTSLNEIAGSVKVLGEGGIVVRNDGDAIIIGSEHPVESGIVQGNDRQYVFTIKPLSKINSSTRVTATVVSPTTTITCGVAAVDVVTNTITIITSAALMRDEKIHWSLQHR